MRTWLPPWMNNDLIIERVTEQNFNDLLFLIDKLAEYEKLTPPDTAAKARLRADGLSDDPKYEAYLGMLGNKPIGYLILFFTYSSFLAKRTLYLEDIFVLEEHRRKGIGKKLFGHCVNLAKVRGCGCVEFCVLDWNEPALKFYTKNNAKRLDWTFFRLDRDDIEAHSGK
jgi:GNAT superfamily N-acetyltransferase